MEALDVPVEALEVPVEALEVPVEALDVPPGGNYLLGAGGVIWNV